MITEPRLLSDDELAEIRERHHRIGNKAVCECCRGVWPCNSTVLLSAVEALREENESLKEHVHFDALWHHRYDARLQDAEAAANQMAAHFPCYYEQAWELQKQQLQDAEALLVLAVEDLEHYGACKDGNTCDGMCVSTRIRAYLKARKEARNG